jgi:hypothetical protein
MTCCPDPFSKTRDADLSSPRRSMPQVDRSER